MICVSLADISPEQCLLELEGLELAEIRIDRMQLTEDQLKEIFSCTARLVATCRPGGLYNEKERRQLLLAAIDAGAGYVDIEVEAEDELKRELLEAARHSGCKLIVSFHDYSGTPDTEGLRLIVERCFQDGADTAKIACTANSPAEAARILGLLDDEREIIAIGMGEYGRITRIAAPILGSPFTYASVSDERSVAPGQIDYKRLRRFIREIQGD